MANIIDHLHNRFKARIRWIMRRAFMLDKITNALVPADKDDIDNPAHIAKTTILFGMWMIVLVFGVMGLWSVLARIDSAAIAPGRVVVDSNRKTISHLEGGIVEEIMVKDGEMVKVGQPLVKLKEISAKARVELIKDKYYSDLAIEARLNAERDKRSEITFPKELLALQKQPEIASVLDNQRRIFTTHTENMRGQVNILKKRIEKYEEEIKGLQVQAEAMANQITFLNEEISVVEELLKKGNAVKPRLLSLKRQAAELRGRQGEYMSLKAKARESIDETNLEILNTESEYLTKVVDELKTTQADIADLRERMAASVDILDRVIIRSPDRGIVNDLSVHTVGGIVKPGEKILDIIPVDDKLIVEAKIAPQDIDVVRPGLKARVRLTAYKTRQVPPVDGVVEVISADQFNDERTGQSYFKARVTIDHSELEELGKIELYPGMPAEVLIVTGSRTFLGYMLDPITQSFNHSFRQQ